MLESLELAVLWLPINMIVEVLMPAVCLGIAIKWMRSLSYHERF